MGGLINRMSYKKDHAKGAHPPTDKGQNEQVTITPLSERCTKRCSIK